MKKFIYLIILTIVILNFLNISGEAQQRRATKEPFQIIDASTGKTISEVLIIPIYSSASGIFVAPEGPSKINSINHFSNNPFVYRSGEPFRPKRPQFFSGLPLFPVFIGKSREIEGIVVIAPRYRPLWFEDLWWYPKFAGDKRLMQLTQISDDEWSLLLKKELSPLVSGAPRTNENCQIWHITGKCALDFDYNKKERDLVRSFIQAGKVKDK